MINNQKNTIMKAKKQLRILLFLGIILCYISCDNDDKVDISQLIGKWSVYNDDPNLAVDGSVEYTFKDDTCSIYSYDALSNRDTTIMRTYIVSNDNKIITIFNKENAYTEQYYILKLTSKEMKWENASPNDGNSNKRLRKLEE